MNIRRLHHLVVLADEGSFRRAAEKVHLSQPAFSRSIQAAEAELGLKLFDRGPLEAKATPAGAFVVERARRLLQQTRNLERDVSLYREHAVGTFGFGCGPFAAAPQLQPQQVWRAFSEPCTLAGARPLLIPPRVAVLASDGQRSIEVARRLADRFDHPLVYRRFAGARPGSRDVGAAYLDLPLPAALLRVLAVSRRAFAHPLVHESLRHAGRLTLLVGTQETRAMELAVGVAAFLGRADLRPAIELVAESPDVGSFVAGFLRNRTGLAVSEVEGRPGDAQLLALLMGPRAA